MRRSPHRLPLSGDMTTFRTSEIGAAFATIAGSDDGFPADFLGCH
jgi:hypothetical protein